MGLGDVAGRVVPKVGILSAPPRRNDHLTLPRAPKRSTRPRGHRRPVRRRRLPPARQRRARRRHAQPHVVGAVEHPSGRIEIDLSLDESGHVPRASLVRTARRISKATSSSRQRCPRL